MASGRSHLTRLLIALALCVSGSVTLEAQMYRWKDEHGVTHYGDVVPPKYRDQAQVEMSNQGLTLRKLERALTPAERAALEAKRKAEEIEAQKREAVERMDRALLSKYANLRELAAAHERELSIVDDELVAFSARAQELSKEAFALLALRKLNRDQKQALTRLSADLSQIAEILERKLKERDERLSRQNEERARFVELLARKGKTGS